MSVDLPYHSLVVLKVSRQLIGQQTWARYMRETRLKQCTLLAVFLAALHHRSGIRVSIRGSRCMEMSNVCKLHY